jgi:predicted RNA methylase
MTSYNDELNSMECDSLLYGMLASLVSEEKEEVIAVLTHLLDKLNRGDTILPEQVISVTLAFVEDLEELGYLYDEDSEDPDEDLIEFEIKTLKDEDPKKRLN